MSDAIKRFVSKNAIRMTCDYADKNPNLEENDSEWAKKANHWKCVLKMKGKQFTVFYSMGCGLSGEPKTYEVIESLKMDAFTIMNEGQKFEEWASSLGYDTDSRKAHKTWITCKRQAYKFFRFLGVDAVNDLEKCEEE